MMSDPLLDLRKDIETLELHLAHDIEALEGEYGVRVTGITISRFVTLQGEQVHTHAQVTIDRGKRTTTTMSFPLGGLP